MQLVNLNETVVHSIKLAKNFGGEQQEDSMNIYEHWKKKSRAAKTGGVSTLQVTSNDVADGCAVGCLYEHGHAGQKRKKQKKKHVHNSVSMWVFDVCVRFLCSLPLIGTFTLAAESSSFLDFWGAHRCRRIRIPSLYRSGNILRFIRQSLSQRIIFPFISIFAFYIRFFFLSFLYLPMLYTQTKRAKYERAYIACDVRDVVLYAHYDDTRRRLLNKVHCTHASPWPLRTLSRLVFRFVVSVSGIRVEMNWTIW